MVWTGQKQSAKQDILNTTQQNNVRNCYMLGNMNACMDKGNVRPNQEDAVLLLEHPRNKKFKLLAVADGMGGHQCGEVASLYALTSLIYWFENLEETDLKQEDNIALELREQFYQIDEVIRSTCNGGGTTLAVALVAHRNTFLMNVGDSRIYAQQHQHLKQLSIDHSLCWNLLRNGVILKKDDIRFHKNNNYITSVLGGITPLAEIHSAYISNQNYDKLLLFTDGVTDSLEEEKINCIIERTPFKNLSKELVDVAMNTDSKNDTLSSKSYHHEIQGGIDNCTCAVLSKKL